MRLLKHTLSKVLAKYLSGKVGYEILESKSDKYAGKLLKRAERDEPHIPSFALYFDANRQSKAAWAVDDSQKWRG